MKPVTTAAAIAAAVAALGAACLKLAFLGEIPSERRSWVVTIGLCIAAATAAFTLVYRICTRRMEKEPVLGAARGALAAMATFLVCIVPHALLFPGPVGRLGTLAGQAIFGSALFGIPIAAIGAATGHIIERIIFSSAPRKSLERTREG